MKFAISAKNGAIATKPKANISIELETSNVVIAIDLSNNLDLELSRSIWNLLYLSQKWSDFHVTKNKHWLNSRHQMWASCLLGPWNFKVKYGVWCISAKNSLIAMEPKISKSWNHDLTHDLDHGFSRWNFNGHILGMGRSIYLEWKRCELDTMLDAQWACSWATVAWQIDRPSSGSVWNS